MYDVTGRAVRDQAQYEWLRGTAPNTLTLEAFVTNSYVAPVVAWMPCPACQGTGGTYDEVDPIACRYCGGIPEVPIVMHDEILQAVWEDSTL